MHQYVTFASTSPLQQALAEYMTAHPEHHVELPAFYQERRDYFAALLAATKFRPLAAAGTYFQLADYSAISTLPDVEFARWLTIEHGVATIPVSVFYREPPERAARAVLFRQGKRDTRRGGGALAAACNARGARGLTWSCKTRRCRITIGNSRPGNGRAEAAHRPGRRGVT